MRKNFIAAVVQMNSTADKEQNFKIVKNLITQAKQGNAEIIFFPEGFAFMGGSSQELLANSTSLDHTNFQRYQQLAKTNNIYISYGGYSENINQTSVYNSHILVSNQGQIIDIYKKIHLFDYQELKESSWTQSGQEIKVLKTIFGNIGLSTCYDIRFSWLFEKQRFSYNAHILTAPSAFTVPTGKAHWEILLRARAIENQCYMIAAAQSGKHSEKRASYGHAMIISPWGEILAQINDSESTGIGFAEINLDKLTQIREKMPIEQHRQQGLNNTQLSKL